MINGKFIAFSPVFDLLIYFFNNAILRQDKRQILVEKFVKKNLALLCSILDENGFFIALEIDNSIKKSIDLELLSFYSTLESVFKNNEGILNFEQKIEGISFYGIETYGIRLLIKMLTEGELLVAIFPSWIDLQSILPEFKKMVKNLSNYIKREKFLENLELA